MAALNGKGVRVELRGGGAMRLRFDFDTLIEIEDVYGSLEGFQLALATKPFTTIRSAIWLAGKWIGTDESRPESEKELGSLLEPQAMKGMSDTIAKALVDGLGLEEVSVEDPPVAVAVTPSQN